VHSAQCPGHQNGQHRYVCNGLPLVYHYGRWPDPPSISPRGFIEDGTYFKLLVESGGLDTTLACRGASTCRGVLCS